MSPALLALALLAAPDAGGPAPGPADAGAVDPRPPDVSTRLEPREVRVGEPVRFEVLLAHDGTRTFSAIDTLDLGSFELLDRQAPGPGPPGPDGRVVDRYVFVLATFEPGEHRVPDLVLPYLDPEGREFTVTAPGGVVRCRSVLANESEVAFRPPPAPVPVIVEDRTLLYAGGALGLVLLTALVAFAAARVWHGRRRIVPPPPPVPAEVIARGRLETLRSRDLPGQGLVKEFYLELSHILREYFGNRYRTNALEMTSTELLEFLTEDRLAGVPQATVAGFLDESDLVKFAKARPSEAEIEDIFASAHEIVERTTQQALLAAPSGEEGQA